MSRRVRGIVGVHARFTRLTTVQIFEPVAPATPLVETFGLYPGSVTVLGGFGFGGKTIFAQNIALAIAAGDKAFGTMQCAQGRAVHVDDEQSRGLTCERYQRLARGAGIAVGDLDGRLEVVPRPRVRLDADGAEAAWAAELRGYQFACFDSLRSLSPSIDENSSESRRVIDMLAKISDDTQCSVLVLHHARKPTRDAVGGARMALRGSGAFYDAAGAVWLLVAQEDQTSLLVHAKDRITGSLSPNLKMHIEDVARDGDDRWGLRVRIVPAASTADPDDSITREVIMRAVLEFLTDREPQTKSAIAAGVHRSKGVVCKVVDLLVAAGAVTPMGKGFVLTKKEEDPTQE